MTKISAVAALLSAILAFAPGARVDGPVRPSMSLDDAIAARRSVRVFDDRALSEREISRLAWAAQGISDPSTGHRTAPSAGATYPLELYVVTRDAVFHYEPALHALAKVSSGDRRSSLAHAALDQDVVKKAPAVFVFAGVRERTAARYGDRADRYMFLEAGHAAQNVLLEAVVLDLGAVPIGAFDDKEVARVVGFEPRESALYLVAVGAKRP